jgi:tRNA(Ile)-lysidine synthetase-like protein
MYQHLEDVLSKYIKPGDPILFGYSGGVDSSCLFYLLKRYKETKKLNLHVVHVYHGWRKEALEEAYMLKKQVEALGFPFYLETITSVDPSQEGNIEEKYRLERLRLFRQLYQTLGAKALLLAHQKEDLGETIFKRIFEGASLSKLACFRERSVLEDMQVIRPLLPFSKEQLYALAAKEGVAFIEDATNLNTHYLRARQRVSIFPTIEQSFGKNSLDNLCKLGKSFSRYEDYMEKRVRKYHALLITGPLGSYLDLSLLESIEPLELEYFIRKILESFGQRISYEALEMVIQKIEEKASNKCLKFQGLTLVVDRHFLFFIPAYEEHPLFKHKVSIQQELVFQGLLWKISPLEEEKQDSLSSSSWKDFWKGEVIFRGLEEDFSFKPVELSYRYQGKSLKSLYVEHKVPALLRHRVPNIFQQEKLICNPLISLSFKEECDKKRFKLSIKSINA